MRWRYSLLFRHKYKTTQTIVSTVHTVYRQYHIITACEFLSIYFTMSAFSCNYTFPLTCIVYSYFFWNRFLAKTNLQNRISL